MVSEKWRKMKINAERFASDRISRERQKILPATRGPSSYFPMPNHLVWKSETVKKETNYNFNFGIFFSVVAVGIWKQGNAIGYCLCKEIVKEILRKGAYLAEKDDHLYDKINFFSLKKM
jgi:hypothetical protein